MGARRSARQKAFRGVGPGDRERASHGLTIFRIEDGQIVEGWGNANWG